MYRSIIVYKMNSDFDEIKNVGGFVKNNLILLKGKKELKNGEYKEFAEGWYDTNLNLISDITQEDQEQIEAWGDIPY